MHQLLKKWARAVVTGERETPRTVLIAGRPGVGKTWAAHVLLRWFGWNSWRSRNCPDCGPFPKDGCLCYKKWINLYGGHISSAGLTGLFVNASKYDGMGDTKLSNTKCIRVLLIDDLGGEKIPPPSFEPGLRGLLDFRQESKLWTILTTNLTSDELTDRFGERSYSRILLAGAVVVLTGKDWRGVGRAAEYSNWRPVDKKS